MTPIPPAVAPWLIVLGNLFFLAALLGKKPVFDPSDGKAEFGWREHLGSGSGIFLFCGWVSLGLGLVYMWPMLQRIFS